MISNPDKPEPNRFEDKKIDHESTKIRRHESLNVVLFRAFNLSCFRDCVSEFSARKNVKIITKVLIFRGHILQLGQGKDRAIFAHKLVTEFTVDFTNMAHHEFHQLG